MRSRDPRSYTEQLQLDSATAWLNDSNRTPAACPIQDVTHLIYSDTSIGITALSKYDPFKLTSLYSLMRKPERVHIVQDLRLDVSARSERDLTWRQVMEMSEKQGRQTGDRTAAWRSLEVACQRAMDVTQQLRERLRWCENEFEVGRLPVGASGEERVCNEGLEIQSRKIEKGKALE